MKPTPGSEHRTGAVVGRHADRLWNNAPTPPLLTSFAPVALEGARSTAAHLPRGLLLDALRHGWLEQAIALDCVAVVCDHPLLDMATVAKIHGAGMKCLSYTVNDEWSAQRLLQLRTDGIITDRIDLFPPG